MEGRVTSRRWIVGARELPSGVNAVLPRRCAGARPRTTAKLSRLGASKQASKPLSLSRALLPSSLSFYILARFPIQCRNRCFSPSIRPQLRVMNFLALNLLLLLSFLAVVVALQLMSVGTCGRWTIWASTAVGRGELSDWFQTVEEQLITDFLGSWGKKKKLVQFFVNIIQFIVSPCAAGCCCGSVYFFTAAFGFLSLFLSFPCRYGEESL